MPAPLKPTKSSAPFSGMIIARQTFQRNVFVFVIVFYYWNTFPKHLPPLLSIDALSTEDCHRLRCLSTPDLFLLVRYPRSPPLHCHHQLPGPPLRLPPAPPPQSLATTSWLNGLRQCRLPPLLLRGWPAGIASVAVWQRFQRNGPGRGRSSRTWRRWHRTLAMETIASMRWSSSSSCPLFYHWALLQCTWPQQQRRCRGEDYTPVIQLNDCLTNEIELTMKSMMLLARIMSITEGGSSSTWILVSAITAMKANQMENGTHFVTK